MLAKAVRLTFADRSIIWRVPLLTAVTATGFGIILTLGYGFAVQNHIAEGGDEYPDVDLEVVWYGLKYQIVLLVLAAPAFLLVGGIAMPAVLSVSTEGLIGTSTWAEAWTESSAQMTAFVALFALWAVALIAIVPASIGAYLHDDGRFVSALSPAKVVAFARMPTAAYAQLVGMLLAVATVATLILLGVQAAVPLGSALPMVLVFGVLFPAGIATYLCMNVWLGLQRHEASEADPLRRFGWEHLEDQREGAGAAESDVGDTPRSAAAEGGPDASQDEGAAPTSSEVTDVEPA